ncbi:MAG: protein kinase [Polyangiaceae bacterium]
MTEPVDASAPSFGDFQFVRRVGKGGFAEVWLAKKRGPGGFEKRVALKVILPKYGRDPSFRTMFMEEARVAAQIEHPNVVRVTDFGEVDDVLYLEMEYVRGAPLATLVRESHRTGRRIPARVILRIVADTAAGLHSAHELQQGGRSLSVVHRDVSPQNILVDRSGVAKLIDFGIVKATGRIVADTTPGFAKGKLVFMAPEQALGREVDRRADVWALAAVAYDVLEGRPPFDGPNDLARMSALVVATSVRPMEFAPSEAVRDVLMKALAVDPSSRYADALSFRRELERAAAECGGLAGHEEVAAFFGPLVDPDDEGGDAGIGDDVDLRARLGVSREDTEAETGDVPVPPAPIPAAPVGIVPSGTSADFASVETSPRRPRAAEPEKPRGSGRIVPAFAVIALAIGTVGLAVVVSRERSEVGLPTDAADAGTTTDRTKATATIETAPPETPSGVASATSQAPFPSPTIDPVRKVTTVAPRAPSTDHGTGTTTTPRPNATTKGAASSGPTSGRPAKPRYDDTIQ